MSPCQSCGACCARFEVSFYSEEKVPEGFFYETGLFTRTLKTQKDGKGRPRCVALRGEIGCSVACGIYENRPTPCREFKHSYEDGGPAELRCDQARAAIGLPPLPAPVVIPTNTSENQKPRGAVQHPCSLSDTLLVSSHAKTQF